MTCRQSLLTQNFSKTLHDALSVPEMKKDPKVMIPRLDAATWTVIRRPWRTTQAVTADEESAKVEERLQAPGLHRIAARS